MFKGKFGFFAMAVMFCGIAVLFAVLSMPKAAEADTVDLPQTGQTTIYATGDDGDIQAGVAWPSPRFTGNGNGTITDNLTGLVWPANGGSPTVGGCIGGYKSWQGALNYVACLNTISYLGHSDWRLPNVNELESLINAGESDPAAWLNSQGFSNVSFYIYWASSTYTGSTDYAWNVRFWVNVRCVSKAIDAYFVWPVRGTTTTPSQLWKTGQTTCYDVSGNIIDCDDTGQDGELQRGVEWPSPRFTDNDNGTITDNLTGLVWLKNADCFGTKTWSQALSDANNLASGNCGLTDGSSAGDWRLPNRKELRSLIDYSQYGTALTASHPFTNVRSEWYWLSTTYARDPQSAIAINIWDGFVNSYYKANIFYVWPVRDELFGDPDITAEPSSKDFGNLNVGSSSVPQTFTITNNGTNSLYISTVSITGDNADQFSTSNDNCSNETIAPLDNCTVEATFSPTSVGAKSANLRILSNDPDTPNLDIALSGMGIVQYTLTVNINPSGGGMVTGSGINCPLDCTEVYDYNTSVNLTATANSGYIFSHWTGCDSPSGNTCLMTMDNNKNVTAVFDACSNRLVKIAGTSLYYTSIQEAYNSALDGDIIQIQAGEFIEDIDANRNITVTLEGGYNCDYTDSSGDTVINGSITLNAGPVIFDRLTFQ